MAIRSQTTALNVAREYCQHLFLSTFYQQEAASRVLFKGGTALRVIYGSPRFSEDLDFSGFGIRPAAIENLIEDTLSAVERVGVAVDIAEAKTTSGGYLGVIRHQVLEYRVETQLEISLRGRTPLRGETALIAGDLLPAYTLLHLPQDLLVEEKLTALLTRAKPRDFYDLYFLLRKGMVPQAMRRRLPEVLTRLQAMQAESLRELRLFLPRDHQSLVKDFRATLARELKRYLPR
ncbi:MAG: nucleotidyl transferase AbiEii/AbiGii toxin family protein [Candidatus Omnitrophica bacterium]|nr:nucleotidyl transferase AbiEii/AbiGii toxin family protein [Candidatus Omnitrophota bacterium]